MNLDSDDTTFAYEEKFDPGEDLVYDLLTKDLLAVINCFEDVYSNNKNRNVVS